MGSVSRRRLLRFAVGGAIGAFWRQSDGTRETERDEPSGGNAGTGEFDPTRHGFGFSNWDGTTGTSGNGAEFIYEPGEVTRGEVRRAIENSWSTAFSEAKKRLMTRVVYSWIGGNAATNGHCYGMSFAADAYYQNTSELPPGVDTASEIPHPTGAYSAVGDRIRRLQTSQLLRAEPYWFALLGLRWGLADHGESLQLLTEAIDATGTGGLAIDGEANGHQVLAHGYERTNGVTTVSIYDPTYEAAAHEDPDAIWRLSVDRESGEITEIEEGYDTFLYHDPEMDSTVIDRILDGRERVVEQLSNAVFLGVDSGTLDIDAPDDVIVDSPAAEFADPDSAPYNESFLVVGSFDEVAVSLDGDTDEEFSLELFGLRDGEQVLEDVIADAFGEVPTQLQITVDDAGEFVVDVVEGVQGAAEEVSGAPDRAGENVEEAGERAREAGQNVGESEGGDARPNRWERWLERPGLLGAAGGAAGFGIVYWLLAGRREEGER